MNNLVSKQLFLLVFLGCYSFFIGVAPAQTREVAPRYFIICILVYNILLSILTSSDHKRIIRDIMLYVDIGRICRYIC